MLWPFFTKEEKGQWESECCTEFNILKGSPRERMCMSTLTAKQNELVVKHDKGSESDRDGVILGQDWQLTWTREGAHQFGSEKAQSGQPVSDHFLLHTDTSVRDGESKGWWQVTRKTESSLLQIQSSVACPPPFAAFKQVEELAETWRLVPSGGWDEVDCGDGVTEGQVKDSVAECHAFYQNGQQSACFSFKSGGNCKLDARDIHTITADHSSEDFVGNYFVKKDLLDR